jgi:hypothetical protein
MRAIGLVELFNVFNHTNYGGYSTAQGLANHGQPTSVANPACYPREAQPGFRFAFQRCYKDPFLGDGNIRRQA